MTNRHHRDRDQQPARRGRPEPSAVGTRLTGVIRSLHEAFGFITASDGCEYFFHKSALDPDSIPFFQLCDGKRTDGEADRVEFTVDAGDKYVVLPVAQSWSNNAWTNAKKVSNDFRYVSNLDGNWMTEEELRAMVRSYETA